MGDAEHRKIVETRISEIRNLQRELLNAYAKWNEAVDEAVEEAFSPPAVVAVPTRPRGTRRRRAPLTTVEQKLVKAVKDGNHGITAIKDEVGITLPRARKMLKTLAARGYVKNVAAPGDRDFWDAP